MTVKVVSHVRQWLLHRARHRPPAIRSRDEGHHWGGTAGQGGAAGRATAAGFAKADGGGSELENMSQPGGTSEPGWISESGGGDIFDCTADSIIATEERNPLSVE